MHFFVLSLILWVAAAAQQPAFVREGDRVEQEFRAYRDRLEQFFVVLRRTVAERAPDLLSQLQEEDAPPEPVVYGYQLLPTIVDAPAADTEPVTSFSYSWPITSSYVSGERVKLDVAESQMRQFLAAGGGENASFLPRIVGEYRELVTNQKTVDQYIQYNRFWQREISMDRDRYDGLTRIYNLMQSAEPDAADAIRQVLGTPDVPDFVEVAEQTAERVTLRVPVYTDIQDDEFLKSARNAIESMWQAREGMTTYSLVLDIRKQSPSAAQRGEHIDLRAHAMRFPDDGALLLTGAEFTHAIVGRYIALGPASLSARTLAHEFGHVIGFRDGYIRGYRDLGDRGFEILELTSNLEDIMSAPRQGQVQAAHFKLILETIRNR